VLKPVLLEKVKAEDRLRAISEEKVRPGTSALFK
jgi:hypothetical protein